MERTTELLFHPTPMAGAFAGLLLLAACVLGWTAWQRSGFARGIGMLEGLRVLLVALGGVMLCQPEWKEVFRPEREPVVAVLWDDSLSMATQDVLVPGAPNPMTRREHVAALLQDAAWDELRGRYELVIEPFSSADSGATGTDIDHALSTALEKHGELRAAVVLSDGEWTEGESPVNAATRLRIKGVPVYTLAAGSEVALPNLAVASLDPPTFSVVDKTLQIPFTLQSTLARDVSTTVSMTVSDGTVLTKEVTVPRKGEAREVLAWRPSKLGKVDVTLSFDPPGEDRIADDDRKSVEVEVRPEALKVLVVESFPRWEYRYLRNALERDPGVEVSCLLFHPGLKKVGGGPGYLKSFPTNAEHLSRYDVIFLGDVGVGAGELTVEQCSMIKGLVEGQATGLVFMPGMRGAHFSLLSTELDELYPVRLDEAHPAGFGSRAPSSFLLTDSGRRSLLTKLADEERENDAVWRSLPGTQWRSPAVRAKAGTDTLALHEKTRAPLLVTKTFGTGKILFMGTDGAWRWREGVEDKYHYRFWGQVARWMAYQRHMAAGDMIRLFYSPDRPKPRKTVSLNATVLDPTGAPYPGGTVYAMIEGPGGDSEQVRFQVEDPEWGLYTARFTPPRSGEYTMKLHCEETSAVLETTMLVQGQDTERVGQPARPSVLAEIADVSRGEFIAEDQLDRLVEAALSLPEPEPQVKRRRLWSSPWLAGILVSLMAAFWIGRKVRGLF